MRVDGYFNTNDEPAIKLDLITSSIEVLVDTGFAGSLIIPEHLSTGLELRFEGFEEFYTVTGHIFVAPAYSLETNWLGQRVKAPVAISPGRQGSSFGKPDAEELRFDNRLCESRRKHRPVMETEQPDFSYNTQ